jgi:hypothetical protein
MKKIEYDKRAWQQAKYCPCSFACPKFDSQDTGQGRHLDGRQLTGAVLGDTLGAFRDGVLAQLTGKDQPDSGLDLAGRDLRTTAESAETAWMAALVRSN